MKKTIRFFLAAALSLLATGAYADPPGRVGRLNHIAGTVSFAPAEAPEAWSQAVLNRPLIGGDRLWTDHASRAELHVGPTAVRLAPYTSLDIVHLDDDRLQMRLAQGSANLRVRDLDANDVVEVVTPAGTMVVRAPGSYRLSAEPGAGALRASVHSGEAEIFTGSHRFLVPAGQIATYAHGAPPHYEVAAYEPSDEFDRWSADRDRREDALVATRYVSPHMTGYEDLDAYGSWRTVPEYGAVWIPARVAPDWAPYRDGHWAWVAPWGWTWIDDAPWGFAPSHYGRWVRVYDHWAWAPGPIVRRPVYAPALVAFVGGSNWSVSLHSGPAVGWFPLGWREPYRPWYRASDVHVRRVNVTHVTNIHYTEVRHVHRDRPDAVTVVRRQDFVSARPISRSRFRVANSELARAEVLRDRLPAERERRDARDERRAERRPAAGTASESRSPDIPARTGERREGRADQRVEHAAPPAVAERRARGEGQREGVTRPRERTEPPRAVIEPQRAVAVPPRTVIEPRRAAEPPRAVTEPRRAVEAPRAIPEPRRAGPFVSDERAQQLRERADARGEPQRRMPPRERNERSGPPAPRAIPQAGERRAPAAIRATPVAAPVRQAPVHAVSSAPRIQRGPEGRPRADRPQRGKPAGNTGASRS